MKTRRLAIGIFLIIASILPAQQQNEPVITVLDFAASGVSREELVVFTDFLTSHIVETGRYRVIDRMQRKQILKEIEFSYTDCTDESCQLEVGRLLAANQIVVGSVGKVGDRFFLTIKLIAVETGQTLSIASEKYKSMNELLDRSKALTFRFLGAVQKTAGAETGEATASRGGRRGSSVEIALGSGFWRDNVGADNNIPVTFWPILLSLSYVYQFNNLLSLGAFGTLEVPFVEGGSSSASTTDFGGVGFDFGLKSFLGNKVDAFALGLLGGVEIYWPNFSSADLWSYSIDYGLLLGLTLYRKNLFLNVLLMPGQWGFGHGVTLQVGYSFYLRSPKIQKLFLPGE